jgi:primosomal protein N' (replication factor Y)
VFTEAGRTRLRELSALLNPSEDELAEQALLQLCETEEKPLRTVRLRKLADGAGAAQRLLRRGCLEVRETARHTRSRTQTIVAWNAAFNGPPASPAENRIHELLTATYGPLPLKLLLKRAPVTAGVAKRLVKQGRLLAWEEPLAEGEGSFESDFAPPVNVLNAEQKCALRAIQSWLEAREFTVGLLHGVTGSGKTEVYLRAMEAALERGQTALVLVPEIPLTHWVGRLCRARLGDKVAVLHSGRPSGSAPGSGGGCGRARRR